MSSEKIRAPPRSRKANSEKNIGDYRSLKTKTEDEISDDGQDDAGCESDTLSSCS